VTRRKSAYEACEPTSTSLVGTNHFHLPYNQDAIADIRQALALAAVFFALKFSVLIELEID